MLVYLFSLCFHNYTAISYFKKLLGINLGLRCNSILMWKNSNLLFKLSFFSLCTVNTECAAIPDSERVDCGWSGISRLDCEANMCCFSSNGSIPCYFKEGNQRELFRWHHPLLMVFHQLFFNFCSLSSARSNWSKEDYSVFEQVRFIQINILRQMIRICDFCWYLTGKNHFCGEKKIIARNPVKNST